MFRQYLYRELILVPVLSGVFIQFFKFACYSAVEKRIAINRLVQPDGMPNMNSGVFSSLSTAIGIIYGFSSILFSFAAVYSMIIIHDTARVKAEQGRQVHIMKSIISSVDSYRDIADEGEFRAPRYRPLDVLCGTALGIIGACVFV